MTINSILVKYVYLGRLKKADKGVVKNYIKRVTGYSRAQVTRLVKQHVKTGRIKVTKVNRNKFSMHKK
jgi:hypothetical protein